MLVTSKGKARTTKELIDASIGLLIDALESGHSEVLTAYLSAMAKFHYYTFGNVLLIAMEKPGAIRVAGMYSWNQLGRRVRRGEKGIMIFAPRPSRKQKKQTEEQKEEQPDAKATGTERATDGRLVGFRPVYVWDRRRRASQTRRSAIQPSNSRDSWNSSSHKTSSLNSPTTSHPREACHMAD